MNRIAQTSADTLKFAIDTRNEEREAAKTQADIQAEHWAAEKEARKKKATIGSIPAPPPMARDHDLQDYIDMFLSNMESREIPKAAQAKHLLPLLNVKATAAVASMTPEDRDNIETLVRTLMDTIQDSSAYISQAIWNYEKESGDAIRTTALKLTRKVKRLGKDADEILDRLMAEKLMQMFHQEVQQYVREKEPKNVMEAAELVSKYFKLKNVDELKYVKSKQWTHKTREERNREEKSSPKREAKPISKWSNHQQGWKRHFKEKSQDSHQGGQSQEMMQVEVLIGDLRVPKIAHPTPRTLLKIATRILMAIIKRPEDATSAGRLDI